MLASTAAVAADSNSPFDLINGIPLHPLVVHAAVVLVPLSALGVLLMAAVPRFSRKLGWLVVLGALAATGACFVAKLAGQQLAARIGEPGFDHQSLGDLMPWFATGLAVVAAGCGWSTVATPANGPRPAGVGDRGGSARRRCRGWATSCGSTGSATPGHGPSGAVSWRPPSCRRPPRPPPSPRRPLPRSRFRRRRWSRRSVHPPLPSRRRRRVPRWRHDQPMGRGGL